MQISPSQPVERINIGIDREESERPQEAVIKQVLNEKIIDSTLTKRFIQIQTETSSDSGEQDLPNQ